MKRALCELSDSFEEGLCKIHPDDGEILRDSKKSSSGTKSFLPGRMRNVLLSAYELADFVKGGDDAEIWKKTDELNRLILFEALSEVDNAKALFTTVTNILSTSILLERGKDWQYMADSNSRFTKDLGIASNINELSLVFTKILAELRMDLRCEDIRPCLTDRVTSFILGNYDRKIGVTDFSRLARISPSGIMHRLKKEAGKTFIQILNEIRISKAKIFLSSTNISVSEISKKCGFQDQSYFSKVFMKAEGLTPRKFREETASIRCIM